MKVISLHQDLEKTIALAKEQNRFAQQQLYQTFAPKMLSVCRQYIKDIQQAEDVLITSFMKVFTHLETFKNKGSFEGWIKRIVINESISFLRTKKEVSFLEDVTFQDTPTDAIDIQYGVEEIQAAIDSLPDGYKMVFNLYCIEGYKHNEIAEMLSISEGTSKSQLSHARKLLQKTIQHLDRKNGAQ